MNKPTPEKWKRGSRVPERHAIRILNHKGFLMAEARGAGGPWTEVERNAEIIIAAVNACFAVSPLNPLAVAEALPELVEACKESLAFLHDPNSWEKAHNPQGEFLPNMLEAALAKLKGD